MRNVSEQRYYHSVSCGYVFSSILQLFTVEGNFLEEFRF